MLDSSRRAVEAADNVVHAYDLNMQVPDTPVASNDDEKVDSQLAKTAKDLLAQTRNEGSKKAGPRRSKRQRTSESLEESSKPPVKNRILRPSRSTLGRDISPHTASLKTTVTEVDQMTGAIEGVTAPSRRHELQTPTFMDPHAYTEVPDSESVATPGLHQTNIRDLLHFIVNESLRVGGRPESAFAQETDGGEMIEVKTRSADGRLSTKLIDWSVGADVPETVMLDEKDLAKLVSCVFLNAVKFTEEGKIILRASLTSRSKFVVIKVTDTGPGIPEDFLPYLFKPFSREDDSLTRQKEGLGLGLLVAKGLARKIGGDLVCTRSDVVGPNRGSEFELRVPLSPGDTPSRASTPHRTPTPGHPSKADTHPSSQKRQNSTRNRRQSSQAHHGLPQDDIPDPLGASSPSRRNSLARAQPTFSRRASVKQAPTFDRHLAKRYPLTFLVAEDNALNRRLLVSMLGKLGYSDVHEAYDGEDAVQQMSVDRPSRGEKPIDVILMDIWMPNMDGYEATERIYAMERAKLDQLEDDEGTSRKRGVTVLAVTADVTDSALEKVSKIGMAGYLTKPFQLVELEKKILEYCTGGGALEQV